MNRQEALNRLTSEAYPQLVPGWPADDRGYTHTAYVDMIVNLAEGLDEGQDMPEVGAFADWQRSKLELEGSDRTAEFSIDACECCGGLAGERFGITALPRDPAEDTTYQTYEVCVDCYYLLVNGEELES